MSPERVNEFGFGGFLETDFDRFEIEKMIAARYFSIKDSMPVLGNDEWSVDVMRNDAFDIHMKRRGDGDFLQMSELDIDAQPRNCAVDSPDFERAYKENLKDFINFLQTLGKLTIEMTPVGEAD